MYEYKSYVQYQPSSMQYRLDIFQPIQCLHTVRYRYVAGGLPVRYKYRYSTRTEYSSSCVSHRPQYY